MMRSIAAAGAILLLSGCAWFMGPTHDQVAQSKVTQSALRYLYPTQQQAVGTADVTQLQLPLRVGVAFLPDSGYHRVDGGSLNQALNPLLKVLQAQPFVRSAVALPHDALTPSGGFAELDKLSLMHRIDVVMLIGYQQTAYSAENPLALLDLSIVGAYVIPGHNNEVTTQLTATAIHVASRRYLLSADSVVQASGHSTLSHAPSQIREKQSDGFVQSVAELEQPLQLALTQFKTSLKSDNSIKIAGGSAGGVTFLMLISLLLYRKRK